MPLRLLLVGGPAAAALARVGAQQAEHLRHATDLPPPRMRSHISASWVFSGPRETAPLPPGSGGLMSMVDPLMSIVFEQVPSQLARGSQIVVDLTEHIVRRVR